MFGKHNVLIGLLIVCPAITAFSDPLQAAEQGNRFPWGWALIILVLIVLLIWWWRRSEEETAPTARAEAVTPTPVVEAPAPAPAPAPNPAPPDNLKRIEGIGPKISGVLNKAGITTFAQLAETDVSRLTQILTDAGLSALADPTTWPEQAHLAAAGEWDALETLQDELKGGRRA